MKLKHYLLVVGIIFLLASLTFYAPQSNQSKPPSNQKKAVLVSLIKKCIQEYHYKPKDLDNTYSKQVFDTYLEHIDYNKRFLTASDIDKINDYITLIDDELKRESFQFFDLTSKITDQRVDEAHKYCMDILEKPFDYSKKETIELDPKKLDFADGKKELKDRWRKTLKHQVLGKMLSAIEEQEKKKDKGDEDFEEKSMEQLEEESRKKILESYEQYFSRRSKLDENDHLATFLNVVTTVFDPHTNYYPPKDKENFDISMSGRLEGIGATLQEKDGYIKVVKIVPGSASWKQGELKAGYIILKVGQGDEEPIDIVDMRLDEAVKLIRGPKGTEVRLTVRKLDGTETIIPITRDVVILEETYAKSALLKDEDSDEKIGYIHLPKFYADFNGNGGRNCYEDVKKEVEKLKKDDVSGIIIDLRDNGGGSLQDVVRMGGLFIKDGPVVQVKGRFKSQTYEDQDPRTQYDGPLVIMVNYLSASASEILAAALQDYRRAVIVGSKSTYGKGTVQTFVNLDDFINEKGNDILPLGAIKLTIQKFYRINGGATQNKGVIPDIILPDEYDLIDYGEAEMDYALEWDEIQPADYKRLENSVTNLEEVIDKSSSRVSNDSVFIKISEKAKMLKDLREHTTYSLNLEEYKSRKEVEKSLSSKYDKIMNPIKELEIEMVTSDYNRHEEDSSYTARFEDFQKTLKKDSYLYETLQIIQDMN